MSSEFQSAIGEGEGESEFADDEKDKASQIPVATVDTNEVPSGNYLSTPTDSQIVFARASSPLFKLGSVSAEPIHTTPRVVNHKHKPSLEEEPYDVDQSAYLSFLPSDIISDIQGASTVSCFTSQVHFLRAQLNQLHRIYINLQSLHKPIP